VERHTVDTSFGAVALGQAGTGTVALFVHGVLMNGRLWEGVMAAVASERRRCIAPDLLGHGGTVCRDPGQDLSFGPQAEMLAELIERLGIGSVDLVGNDSGGAICQILAARHPQLVRTLVLTNCDTDGNIIPPALIPFVESCRRGKALAMFEPMLEDLDAARSFFAPTLRHPASVSDETLLRFIEPLVRNERRERAIERWMNDVSDRDLHQVQPALAQLTAPTSIIWGDDDVFFPVDDARRLAAHIASTERVVELPGERLFFPLEHPGLLAEHLVSFWPPTT
jgi:pimeloyl-ACP methyl ester carboxylesterase